MGGHSHWKGIKEKKGKLDKARGKLFAKLLRAIEIASRQGDSNPENNPTLFDAIQRAKDASVPKDNIDRAVARGSGETGGEKYDTIFYEGYAPGGVAMLVEGLTNNRNRTSQDLRSIFSKYGGSLGEPGSVKWMFDKRGVIVVAKSASDEERLMEIALDAGAEDVRDAGDDYEVVCEQAVFVAVRDAVDAASIERLSAEVTMLPQNTVAVDGENAKKVLRMMEALEDHDDVQAVYANFDIPDEVFAEV
ncbi:MAG TPA: YebC/PmpR family DNA-binding transcriptional regulator [Actinomycetota bacterium]